MMANKISEFLSKIKNAVYGIEVRDAIHDSILQCYSDVTASKTIADDAAEYAIQIADMEKEKIDQLTDNYEKLENDLFSITTSAITKSPIERVGLYWGDGVVHGSVESKARACASMDIVGISGVGSDPVMGQIIQRSRELNPDIRWVRYVDAGSGKLREKMRKDISDCLHFLGTGENGSMEGGIAFDGIFFDQFDDLTNCGDGKEYLDSIHRQNDLIDYSHELGFFVIGNAWDFLSHVSGATNSWNTLGIASTMGEKDYWLIESCTFWPDDDSSSASYNKGKWGSVSSANKLRDYYVNIYGKTCSANAIDFSSSGSAMTAEDQRYQMTWLLFSTLARGGRALCFDRGPLIGEDTNALMAPYYYGDHSEVSYSYKMSGTTAIWTMEVNNHIIQCMREATVGGVANKKSFDGTHIFVDGVEIKNTFASPSMIEYSLQERFDGVDERLDNYDPTVKTNATAYLRMAIDDWRPTRELSQFENHLVNMVRVTVNGVLEEARDGTNIDGSLSDWTSWGNLNYQIDVTKKLEGKTLEFGCENFTSQNPNLRLVITDGSSTAEIRLTTQNGSNVSNQSGFCVPFTVADGAANITIKVQCFGGSSGTGIKWSVTNLYLCDPTSVPELEGKDWYSNLTSVSPTETNGVSYDKTKYTYTRRLDDSGHVVFDLTATLTTSHGALRTDHTVDEVMQLRGHRLEAGCVSFSCEVGNPANVRYLLGANWQATGFKYDTLADSEVFGDKRPCVQYTVPEDATKLASGLQLGNIGSSGLVTITGLYLYDLDEDNILIRGKNFPTSWLQICRVTDEKLALDRRLVPNALYITDSGKMFITDFNRNRIDLIRD